MAFSTPCSGSVFVYVRVCQFGGFSCSVHQRTLPFDLSIHESFEVARNKRSEDVGARVSDPSCTCGAFACSAPSRRKWCTNIWPCGQTDKFDLEKGHKQ